MRKNPCRGSFHTKRSKLGPNPYHHLLPMSKEVVDRTKKRTLTAKKGIPSTNHKFPFPQNYSTANQKEECENISQKKRKISCSKKSTESPLKKHPIEARPKGFSQNFRENKRNKNRSWATKYRTSSRVADEHRKNTVSRQNIYTSLPVTIEEFQEKRKTDLEDVKVTFLKLQIYQNNNRPGLKSRDRSMERKTREKRQSKKTEKNID